MNVSMTPPIAAAADIVGAAADCLKPVQTTAHCSAMFERVESISFGANQDHYSKAPFTRYNRLSNRLYNRFDNRLYRVNGV